MKHSGLLIRLILVLILAVAVVSFVRMKVDIAQTESEIDQINDKIRDQRVKNNEYSDILSEDNIEDFYKNMAEDDLGFGFYDEKIYVDITGY